MIIDSHTHILPQRRLNGLSIWLARVFSDHPLAGKPFTAEKIVGELSRNGVTHMFNYVYPMKADESRELNRFNDHLAKKYPFIIPFGSFHVENSDKKAILNECANDFMFMGFKLHPYVQGFSPDDERLLPAYERIEQLGKPINIHTGFEDYYPKVERTITLSMMEGLIRRFSSLTFIIPHMFYPRLEEGLYLLENYKNVYLDTTNVFSALYQDEEKGLNRDREREILLKTLSKWSKRMFFGTDHPAGMSDLETIFKDFYSFQLTNDMRQDLLFKAAHGFAKQYGYINDVQPETGRPLNT
jgi:predicted TIM-barrel fold metal-dependent hydrolase